MRLKCKAVLFDAAGTLFRVEPSAGHVYAAEAARYGVHVAPEALTRAFWETQRECAGPGPTEDPLRTSEDAEAAWWREAVERTFAKVGRREAFGDQFDRFFEGLYDLFAKPEVWRVLDDVEPALSTLAAMGMHCAVLSNWDTRLPRLLEAMELRRYFEFVLTSAEAGYRKPAPQIFHDAVSRLGIPAEHVAYVGDSYETDFLGARQAGLKAVLIDRSRSRSAPCPTLTALTELPDWLVTGGRPEAVDP